MKSPQELLLFAERLAEVEEVECVTPDLNGIARGKTMTAAGFLSGRRLQMARGVLLQCLMGGYPPTSFYGSDDSDLLLRADPQQIHLLPWSDTPRALAICDALEVDGSPCALSTRGLLRQVLDDYAELGLRPVVATELEFFVFAANPDPREPFLPPQGLDGRREVGASAFTVSSSNGLRPFFAEVYRCMAALGMPRDTFMHEMGTSQFEINFPHGDALQLADQTFLFKHLLREVALRHGLQAVCMAKPLGGVPGSSMHIHQSLVDDYGRNVFSDAEGEPTALFAQFIGGLQSGLAELTLLLAPNVNSYHRLAHPYASPNNACWAYDNRAAGLRIPASGPQDRRVENRVPGADANPYLALAASLGAGLYGLVQGLQPTLPARGEFQVPDALRLPTSMGEALYRLQRSRLARELFGEAFIDGYLATKSLELNHFLEEITPWERRLLAPQV